MSASDSFILETLLTLCLLLFAAKVGGEIAKYFKVAAVVGELLAGVLLAPTLLGGLQVFDIQLINVNETVQVFAELGAVLLLFLVGLETRFADFRKSGVTATVVAIGGVVLPFILGYGLVIVTPKEQVVGIMQTNNGKRGGSRYRRGSGLLYRCYLNYLKCFGWSGQ
jgi:Kef-type K+ transport system membrane component KefB